MSRLHRREFKSGVLVCNTVSRSTAVGVESRLRKDFDDGLRSGNLRDPEEINCEGKNRKSIS